MDFNKPISEDQKKANILAAFDTTAQALGNSRNVCRKYYVHPILVDTYERDKLHDVFTKIETTPLKSGYLTPTEVSVLELIKTYTPIL